MIKILTCLFLILFCSPLYYSQQSYKYFNINNISTGIHNNGFADVDSGKSSAAFRYPKTQSVTSIYQSGFIWGAKRGGETFPQVGGSTYRSGLQPGRILSPGIAEDPNLPKNRIYRVRKDVFPGGPTADFSSEMSDGEGTEIEIRNGYQKDWLEWPANDGAPFQDMNGNGIYEPSIDIPGVKNADQTLWFVANDLDSGLTKNSYGTRPLGIELQVTIWGYKNTSELDNVLFKEYSLINKSSNQFNEMYLCVWSDPDIGLGTDDFAGCNPEAGFGFAYNSSDPDPLFGYKPPAIGFNYLKTPNENGMTAYFYIGRGDATPMEPTYGDSSGAFQFYYLMQGKIGSLGQMFTNPITGLETPFALEGNPLEPDPDKRGWIDGLMLPPGLREIGVCSGPFIMNPSDTQKVVFAQFAAVGKDHLDAVRILTFYNDQIKYFYQNDFNNQNLLQPPPPEISLSYDEKINISWGENSLIENFNQNGFKFQGYNVYQLYSESNIITNAKKLATFDLIDGVKQIDGTIMDPIYGRAVRGVEQNGNDSGIKRNLEVNWDYVENRSLIKGKEYFYAVTAYTFNDIPEENFNTTESLIRLKKIAFRDTFPGPNHNNILTVNHFSGNADAVIKAIVYDPAELGSNTYRLTFDEKYDSLYSFYDSTFYNLHDAATNLLLQRGVVDTLLKPLINGFQLKIYNKKGIKDWQIPAGVQRFTDEKAFGLQLEAFNGALGWASPYYLFGGGHQGVSSLKLKPVILKLATVRDSLIDYNPSFNLNDPDISYGYRYGRGFANAPAKPEFMPHIINSNGTYSYQAFEKNVPLSAWDISNPGNPRRLVVGFLENNAINGLVDGKYWPGNSSIFNNTAASGPREWLWIFDVDYSEIPNPELQVEAISNQLPVMYFLTANRMGSSPFSPNFSGEDHFLIIPAKPLSEEDVYIFNSTDVTSVDDQYTSTGYSLYQNFPNPFNPQTKIRFSLEKEGFLTLKIFDILGREVKTLINEIRKKGDHTVTFDAGGFSSGIYIYRIQAGNYAAAKKLLLLK